MQTDQIYSSQLQGRVPLAAVLPGSQIERRTDGRVFAVPHLPGYAERFRPLFSVGQRLEQSCCSPALQGSPQPDVDPLPESSWYASALQQSPYPYDRRDRRR
jgi:hypothetical protein